MTGYDDTQHASGFCSGGALTLLGAALFLAETPSQVSAQSQAQTAIGGSHPQAAASKPPARKASTAAAVHPGQSLASLTRIEILPSSISILGPRYNQRLLVEGTFADGHQEELTPQVTLTVSNPKVAIVDKDHFTLPQGDGQATITGTLQGHRAVGNRERQRLRGRNRLEFSQRCAAGHDQDGM